MIPKKVKLHNAIGIKAGLGLDVLEMDLTTIPDDALVVAIKADNGGGKSTLMNLGLTPWREPPHLVGTLYDQFGDGDGLRELEWTHNGYWYRSTIEIKKSGKTRTMRAYLHVLLEFDKDDDEVWSPVELADHTVSDGKSSTYDACLEGILGPRALYFLSAFRSQGAKTLAEYENPKQLMRDLLDLGELERLSDKANEVAKALRPRYEASQIEINALAGLEDEKSEIAQRQQAQKFSVERALADQAAASQAASQARVTYERALAATADNEEVAARLVDLKADLAKLDTAYEQQRSLMRSDEKSEAQRLEDVRRKSERQIADIAKEIWKHEGRIAEQQALLDGRGEVEAAEYALDGLAKRAEELQQEYVQAVKMDGIVRSQETQHAKLVHDRHSLQADGQRLRQRYDRLQVRAGFVEQVPCGGKPPYNTCPALNEAMEATDTIQTIELELEKMRAQVRALIGSIETLAQTILESKVDINAIESRRDNARTAYQAARTIASRREALDSAAGTVAAAQGDIEALHIKRAIAVGEMDADVQETKDRVEELRLRLLEAQNDHALDRKDIEDKIAALPPVDRGEAVAKAKADQQAAEAALSSANEKAELEQARGAEQAARVEALQHRLTEAQSTREAHEVLGDEVASWKLLSAALRGIIDLSIDDAGPSIATITNELLREAYGPRFSVRMVTQRQLRNGALREAFDILVIDEQTGLESSLLSKSGGETVWINMALCNAVAIHHQESAGIKWECMFGDEVEDGLTQARKQQFYTMERAALARGGYARKFQVSHDPQAWTMADWVIDLDSMRSLDAGQPRPALKPLSAAAKAAREPLPPADIIDAQHDSVHRDPGRSRTASTSRKVD